MKWSDLRDASKVAPKAASGQIVWTPPPVQQEAHFLSTLDPLRHSPHQVAEDAQSREVCGKQQTPAAETICRLVELLHEAEASRDEAIRQLREARTKAEQQTHAERTELEQRYHKLLQERMHCGVKMARLEAELAQFREFMEGYRSSLQREEQGS